MNVTGTRFDRFQENFIHQPNNAGLLSHLGKFAAVEFEFFEKFDAVVFDTLFDQSVDRFATDAKMILDQFGDFTFFRQNGFHDQARRGADFVQWIEVQRFIGRDDDRVFGSADGKEDLTVDDLLRKALQQRQINFHLRKIYEINTSFFGPRS